MKSQLRHVSANNVEYDCLMFSCPGCALSDGHSGIHLLPVNSSVVTSWKFDGNLEAPTLSPSLLTKRGVAENDLRPMMICHSFLRNGVFEFLSDSSHELSGQSVPIPDLPERCIKP